MFVATLGADRKIWQTIVDVTDGEVHAKISLPLDSLRFKFTDHPNTQVIFGKLNDVYAVPGSGSDKVPAPKGASGFIID